MCINLFPFCDDELMARSPVYMSSQPYANTVDLLYCETGENDGTNSDGHYVLIKYFSAFMWDIKVASGNQLLWRKKGFRHFQSQNVFDLHQRYWPGQESFGQMFMMPETGKCSQVYCHNYTNGTGAPFLI